MKKSVLFGIAVCLIFLFTSCKPSQNADLSIPSNVPSSELSPAPSIEVSDINFDKISVSYELDKELNRAVVTITNNDDRVFSGDITVNFKKADGISVGFDTIMVDALAPGNQTWANISIDAKDMNISDFIYDFSDDCKFEDAITESGEGELDNDLSTALYDYMWESFGDKDGAEYAVDWFYSINSTDVYKASNGYYAEIIVDTSKILESNYNALTFAVMDSGVVDLEYVKLIDTSGNELKMLAA